MKKRKMPLHPRPFGSMKNTKEFRAHVPGEVFEFIDQRGEELGVGRGRMLELLACIGSHVPDAVFKALNNDSRAVNWDFPTDKQQPG